MCEPQTSWVFSCKPINYLIEVNISLRSSSASLLFEIEVRRIDFTRQSLLIDCSHSQLVTGGIEAILRSTWILGESACCML